MHSCRNRIDIFEIILQKLKISKSTATQTIVALVSPLGEVATFKPIKGGNPPEVLATTDTETWLEQVKASAFCFWNLFSLKCFNVNFYVGDSSALTNLTNYSFSPKH